MISLDLTTRLIHRDALILILDKPAGLPVHAGPKGGPNLTAMLEQLRFGLPRNPERTVALRKLLEAKDCAVRAKLFK